MKLLDWLFGINKDDAPLVSEHVKHYPMGYKCVARITPVAHGIGGLRLDWAMCELTPENCNRMHSYWRNQQFKSRDGRNATIKPARSYADGFKAVSSEELLNLFNRYSNHRELSMYEGKPTL